MEVYKGQYLYGGDHQLSWSIERVLHFDKSKFKWTAREVAKPTKELATLLVSKDKVLTWRVGGRSDILYRRIARPQ